MTSNDQQQYLTVEMFNSKMDTFMAQIRLENEKLRGELRSEFQTGISGLRSEFQSEISGLRSDMQAGFATLQTQTQVNSAKIDMLQHTFYWGFAIMTLIITFVAIFVPYFLFHRKQKEQDNKQEQYQPGLTEQKVQDMIAQAVGGFKPAGK